MRLCLHEASLCQTCMLTTVFISLTLNEGFTIIMLNLCFVPFYFEKLLMMFFESGWSDYISELTNVGAKKYPAVPPEAVMNLLTK